jgi:hypothetical protein
VDKSDNNQVDLEELLLLLDAEDDQDEDIELDIECQDA